MNVGLETGLPVLSVFTPIISKRPNFTQKRLKITS